MSREAFHKPKNEEKQARNNSDLLTEVFPKNAARQKVIHLLKKALDVFPDVVHIFISDFNISRIPSIPNFKDSKFQISRIPDFKFQGFQISRIILESMESLKSMEFGILGINGIWNYSKHSLIWRV